MVTVRLWLISLLAIHVVNGETIRRERKREKESKHESIQLRTRWFMHAAQNAKASAAGFDTEDETLMLQFEAMIEENMSIATASPSAASIAPSPTTRISSFPTTLPSEGGMTPSPTKSPSEVPSSTTAQPSESQSASPSEGVMDGTPIGVPMNSPTSIPSLRSGVPTLSPSLSLPEVPSASPSVIPTSSSTTPCNMSPQNRADSMLALINVISRQNDVIRGGSPQNLAANWIINGDEAKLCPQDDTWIQRYIMAVFYYSTNGNRWFQCQSPSDTGLSISEANEACNLTSTSAEGTYAWLTPDSECLWAGITCDDSENTIEQLAIESNGVSGTIPFEIRSLQSLVNLSLERGIITGTIPEDVGFIRGLETLDLDNNIIEGTIPLSIYRLTNLQQLDLDQNELQGTISPTIERMTNLRLLQLNSNNLSGTIPTELGKLPNLSVATFERNQMDGTMPSEVCANVDVLSTLTTDCLGAPNRPSPPFVACSCCSGCF
ncbi:unnamed protein product [Cylindrotheca closterium]|uniref:L domain-like protein n=1 Tax=Cylindrotheca closterium TaxID=2856 RepID=A0AAD2CZ99_9STRA|nr:unnamed protein product [Cylindrotheca closterium]